MCRVISPYKRSSSKKAFTLVELLVVISIMSVLLMIMVPAIRSALDRGKKTRCLANMRAWAIAITVYCSDHDGDFPEEGMEGGGLMADKPSAWFNSLPPYMGTLSLWEMIDKLGHPPRPGTDQTPFHCPSFDERDLKKTPRPFESIFSYGYNLWLDHPTADRQSQSDSKHPHTLPRLMNLMYLDNPSILVVFGEVANSEFDNMAAKHIVYRHKRGKVCNLAFADGHAKSFLKESLFVPAGGSKARNKVVVWDPESPIEDY